MKRAVRQGWAHNNNARGGFLMPSRGYSYVGKRSAIKNFLPATSAAAQKASATSTCHLYYNAISVGDVCNGYATKSSIKM